jgi:TRAP-type mannitol/chloroaromatic compound transport system substrate-binding protein
MNKKSPDKNKLSRRNFFKKASLAGLSTALIPAYAISKPKNYEWKMIMTWQKTLPGLGTGAIRLAKRIEDLSSGRIKIKIFSGGELVPPTGIFDAVANGVAELGHTAPYYWLNKNKSCAFFCSVPGGLTSFEQNAWVYYGGGQRLWDELYGEFGLKSFLAGNTGTQMGGWFNKEINQVSDLKGLKVRMPGLAGEVLNRLGGTVQNIPPQELFSAIQSGVIDGLEWVGPWNDIALGFHKAAKYYYGPGFHEGGPALELMINKEVYDGLDSELQNIVKVAAAAENSLMASEFYANNLKTFAVFEKNFNVRPRVLPNEVLKQLFEISKEVVAETATESAISKKIYNSFNKFQKVSIETSGVTEYGFLHARNKFS